MDVEYLLGSMLKGTLGGRKKRSRRAYGYLAGGRGSFINASTLLTVGGLIWGAIETMQQQKAQTGGTVPPSGGGPRPAGPTGWTASGTPTALPPLPGTAPASQTPVPPPVPGGAPDLTPGSAPSASAEPEQTPSQVPEGAVRIIRLMLSAARADGTLTPEEKESIQSAARDAGAEADVVHELSYPTPLASIVEGVTDRKQREDLYTLAFSIVRGDEVVSGGERIYLAQLGALLGLSPAESKALEDHAAARIDEQAGE